MEYSSDDMTAQGFRSLASTLLNELGWPPDAIERLLAHVEENETSIAYNYAAHLPLRRKMMQFWADYLDGLRNKAYGRRVDPLLFITGPSVNQPSAGPNSTLSTANSESR